MNSLVRRFTVRAEEEKNLVRPSQLPLYDQPEQTQYVLANREPGLLEENIKVARESLNLVSEQVAEAGEKMNYVIETGVAHSQGAYNQLLEEDNLAGRVGVIAGGATLGLIVGLLRGRFIKRVLYTTLGAGIGASISYPAEAKQLSEEAYTETRKKAMIAYNFVNGVDSSGTAESSLIASSITRISSVLLRYLGEIRAKIGSGVQTSKVEVDKTPIRKDTVIFESGVGSSNLVEGDPGQSNAEDKDLYTTRQ